MHHVRRAPSRRSFRASWFVPRFGPKQSAAPFRRGPDGLGFAPSLCRQRRGFSAFMSDVRAPAGRWCCSMPSPFWVRSGVVCRPSVSCRAAERAQRSRAWGPEADSIALTGKDLPSFADHALIAAGNLKITLEANTVAEYPGDEVERIRGDQLGVDAGFSHRQRCATSAPSRREPTFVVKNRHGSTCYHRNAIPGLSAETGRNRAMLVSERFRHAELRP